MKYFLRLLMLSVVIMPFQAQYALALPVCFATARVPTSHYPGAAAIQTNNDLTLPNGKSLQAGGQHFVLSGRVVDSNCKPIPEAVIEIWQPDPYGKWNIASRADMASPNPTFAGAGRTISDPEGRFMFKTAFPGTYVTPARKGESGLHAPQINIRIAAPGMADFSTVLFFGNDSRNINDSAYRHTSLEGRQTVTMDMNPDAGPTGDIGGTILITIPGEAQYRTY